MVISITVQVEYITLITFYNVDYITLPWLHTRTIQLTTFPWIYFSQNKRKCFTDGLSDKHYTPKAAAG